MQNIKNKLILGIATLVAVFGIVNSALAATAPIMSTSSAASVTTTSATLNGFFNDGGSPMTQLYFDYGTSPILGTLSPLASIPAGSSGNYSVTITGLTPGTKYYVQAVGTNGIGSTWGNPTITFTTLSVGTNKPVMSTNSATSISSNSATLNGFYNMNGVLGQVYFEYGLSSGSLNNTTSAVSVSSNSGNYSAPISGLNPNTTYYFRAVGVNSNGTTAANTVLSFMTKSAGTSTSSTSCRIISFTASSYYVSNGAPAYLSWSTNNCTSATLSSGHSALSASGYAVYPTNPSSSYTLSATNGSSSDTSYITITVANTTSRGGSTYVPPRNPYPPHYYNNYPNYQNNSSYSTQRSYDYVYNNPTNRVINETRYVYDNGGNTVRSDSVIISDEAGFDSSLTAAAGMSGSNFFPETFMGWLLIALIVLIVILVIRSVRNKGTHSHTVH